MPCILVLFLFRYARRAGRAASSVPLTKPANPASARAIRGTSALSWVRAGCTCTCTHRALLQPAALQKGPIPTAGCNWELRRASGYERILRLGTTRKQACSRARFCCARLIRHRAGLDLKPDLVHAICLTCSLQVRRNALTASATISMRIPRTAGECVCARIDCVAVRLLANLVDS